ncbi:hypothetical protein E6R60_26505 [Streptomyces sp. A0642]|uniref:hypothetical protein n=1 Tax=Streptomyces sp. A0642 TaxID=2563100 RepID=UPI0010A266C2|nr:hypothetical protein [Streptomyces sp. A0642]THA72485.1 hypothetical protein E6R60_26505 [Streptomyces sp. A0642]
MGDSRARQKRKAEEERLKKKRAAEAAKVDTALPSPLLVEDEEGFDEEGVNFLLMPGGMLTAEGAASNPPSRQKTVKVDSVMDAHLTGFLARHGGMKPFTKTTLALWRVLIREEQAQLERAREEQARTGVPARLTVGPLYRKVAEERKIMQEEHSGSLFDE